VTKPPKPAKSARAAKATPKDTKAGKTTAATDRRRLHDQRQREKGLTRILVAVPFEDVDRLKAFATQLRREWAARQMAAFTDENRELGGS